MTETESSEERDLKLFRTLGRDCCHWCSLRPQAWVWGPHGTRVCDHCQEMVLGGQVAEVVDELAARMTVRGTLGMLDLERWRAHELARMYRWLNVRTGFRAA